MNEKILLYFFKTFKIVFLFIILIVLFRGFIVEPGQVNGRSMEPLYLDDELFFINKFSLLFTPPQRGQIVQLYVDGENKGTHVIKRIIGLPGETVYIKQNSVFIIDAKGNETKLEENYIPQGVLTKSSDGKATTYGPLEEHTYFVLGENRDDSIDSRSYGPVHRSYIYGLAFKFKKPNTNDNG